MSAPARVIFINRFYWPQEPATAQLLADLAEGLASEGWPVTVLASGAPSSTAVENRKGVEIRRLSVVRAGRSNLAVRALDFLRFGLAARRSLSAIARPGDTVIALTDPPLLGSAIASIARRQRLNLVHWVQDIFPEVAAAVGRGAGTAFLKSWRNQAWRSAAACVTLGEDMARFLASQGVSADKLHILPNWAPAGLAAEPAAAQALRREWQLEDRFVIGYSGNLGRVHLLQPLVDVAAALQTDPQFAFVFVGAGAQRSALEAEAKRRRLPNVQFFPAQPRERLGAALTLPDLHLITLKPRCEAFVFPSKLYGIAAVGRPALFVGRIEAEIARIVRDSGMGAAFGPAQMDLLASEIRALRDDPARRVMQGRAAAAFAARGANFAQALARWQTLLTAVRT